MFYSQLFISKRGTLAKIWLAAHWEKKITKAHVFECDLEATIKEILSPLIKIGLRTSGHLLLGVVRIYSKKTRYLLSDCSDALVKIKVAFRPGQTDLPEVAMEATLKAITLPEDFTDFDTQLPDLNTIDVVDHFSLNQCRTEDITLKENFGNHFLTIEGIGEEIQSYQGLFDQSFSVHGDCFGDEEMAVDLIDFIASNTEDALMPDFYANTPDELPATPPPTAVGAGDSESVQPELSRLMGRSSPAMTETTFLVNAEEGFALAPVAVTPSSTRKRVARKRKLVIDRSKELTDDAIRDQLADCSGLLTPLEIAPPTRQLMEWRANGGVKQLFSSFCLPLLHPDLKQLFPCEISPRRQGLGGGARQQTDPEETREQTREAVGENTAGPVLDDWSLLQEFVVQDQAEDANTTVEPSVTHPEPPTTWNTTSEESRLEVSYPEPVSEISMFVHPSVEMRETPLMTQTQSALNSQDVEDKRLTSRAHDLFQALKRQDSSPNAVYSLHALCESRSRSCVAAMFFCLLVLRKQQILNLHQSSPYSDIIATPGPLFLSL
ncbi:double-strand-break repair protein rad21-like protein 1 [Megalobrama amblycephala]|uniref:double-strand-break repair protein rad21-like protein 1 n=1 Tax=Megalobrama amblycephala TaxID=75352 RepID=UPI0020140357|nr:double-strand-break repair protein rad21-like protein 1 [Megalobrama amblycephala]